MRGLRTAAIVMAAVALSACAGPRNRSAQPLGPSSPSPASGRYQADATVLQEGDGPSMLCWAVATSYPPQCGDVPIANWDWASVPDEERASGTVWGMYHVVGTFDGETFTVEDTGPYVPSGPPPETFQPACPEPDGGWHSTDPNRASEMDVEDIMPSLRAEADFAGAWIVYIHDPVGEAMAEPNNVILNVGFTGDLERHRAEIEQRWGGPLCLVQRERSLAELTRIQTELGPGNEFGLRMLSSSSSEVHNWVELTVVLAGDEDRAAIDAKYGAGVVRVTSQLRPA